MLFDRDKEISCLKIHHQNLENQIRKFRNDDKSPYGSDNDLEEEIKRLNNIIKDKDEKIMKIQTKLRCQETKNYRLQQQIEELQQKEDDTKKAHKLEITKFNNTLTCTTEEIYQLRNHNHNINFED